MMRSISRSVKLAEVCSIVGTLVDPREPQYRKMIHVGGANMVSGGAGLVDLKSAEDEDLVSGKYLFTEQDVLYSKIRPYLRKVAAPPFAGLCSADVYPLRPTDGRIEREYLYYLLLSPAFTDYVVACSNRAGIPKVNREQLFSYGFKLPALDAQRRLVTQVRSALERADEIRKLHEEALKEAQALRTTILRKAFSGEL
jgi:type I restriction enzyme S subunit